jgi:branched-chain amino acid aminotransferase
LAGITRQTVIDLAKANGYEVVEEMMTVYDLFEADEAFLTGTAAEVIPLVAVDSRKIGCGAPGEVTVRLMQKFREITETGTPF